VSHKYGMIGWGAERKGGVPRAIATKNRTVGTREHPGQGEIRLSDKRVMAFLNPWAERLPKTHGLLFVK